MFCNLTPEALEDYDGIGIMMSHARGAKLFSEGDPARNVFVICFGQVKISSTSRDGKTMILKIAGPGDVMGLSAVLANVPHEVTAEAIEPCQVKTVRKQEFVDFLGRHGIASMHAAQSLSGEYLTVFHDAKRLALSGSAAGRLARLLLDWGRSCGQRQAGNPLYHGPDPRGDRQHGRHLARDGHPPAQPIPPRPVDHHQGLQPDHRQARPARTPYRLAPSSKKNSPLYSSENLSACFPNWRGVLRLKAYYDLDGISPGGYIEVMTWEVEVSDEFVEWYDSLNLQEWESVNGAVGKLELYGPDLGSTLCGHSRRVEVPEHERVARSTSR